MTRYASIITIFSVSLASASFVHAAPPTTEAQQQVAQAAQSGQYAIIVFFKDQGTPTQAMLSTVQQGVEQRAGRAMAVQVDASQLADKPLVERFGVSRAPMPVAVAVAPNGAVTGIYAKTISHQRLAKAFVSPGVADCMKAMQAGKLVFVWARARENSLLPPCVDDFQRDAEFRGRSVTVTLDLADSAEQGFFKELEINPAQQQDAVALLAPPGVLVGTFAANASKEDVAAALHKAGKCCDDPNCKHNRSK
jgi:hypothetical protein